MRLTKDPKLTYFANQAGMFAAFTDDTDGSQIAKLREMANRRIPYHGVTQMGGLWVVRITICGQQFTIGRFYDRLPLNAVRYADLAIAYFWKYRATDRPPEPSDFTLGVTGSTDPICGYVAAQLEKIETYLLDICAIKLPDPAAAIATPAPKKDFRPSALRAWRLFRKHFQHFANETPGHYKAVLDFETDIIQKL